MKNISVENIKEEYNEGKRYILVKINICAKETLCIGVLGEALAFENLGNDFNEAERLFNLFTQNAVSEEHLEEILHDQKMKIYF